MKVVAINTVASADNAPGRIMTGICTAIADAGHEAIAVYGRGKAPDAGVIRSVRMGSDAAVLCHTLMSRLTDSEGLHSECATRQLIRVLDREQPDIIHLHNLHGHYLNYPSLVSWINSVGIPVVWTLHDCWPMTGHCAYYHDCRKWLSGCNDCRQLSYYPKSVLLCRSGRNFRMKRMLFGSIRNLTVVAVSRWLADEVGRSFLGDNPVRVIPNGVETDCFKPHVAAIGNRRFTILGVASRWERRKGLDTFIRLAPHLEGWGEIILVGVDRHEPLPRPVKAIGRITSPQELSRVYSCADLFINPSKAETFGMTTVEAMACGTPVIVNNSTALPECVAHDTGIVVDTGNIDALLRSINEIRSKGKAHYSARCISHIRDNYSIKRMTDAYLSLYNSVLGR